MKLNVIGRVSIFIVVILLLAGGFWIRNASNTKILHTADVNDLAKSILEGKNEEEIQKLAVKYELNYSYVDEQLVIYADQEATKKEMFRRIVIVLTLVLIVTITILLINLIYIEKNIKRPFERLEGFATQVAQGNLNVPLTMDKKNLFGAFTESFDIMREELAAAKESERKANESKKELIASLSHDIKTPLASIRAMDELLLTTTEDSYQSGKLKAIEQKTEQIEELINNLFHATLEELEELKVETAEIESGELEQLLRNADNDNKIEKITIPQCLITCDRLRIQQVFDNIISNSYKYAGTVIHVKAEIEYGYLQITISDEGDGIHKDELPLLKQKYYRGKNSTGKNGAGIGLYISEYFLKRMDGFLKIEELAKGFGITVGIPLT